MNFGSLPPSDLEWTQGNTAASIRFVHDTEHYLSVTDNMTAEDRKYLESMCADLRAGNKSLDQWLTPVQALSDFHKPKA